MFACFVCALLSFCMHEFPEKSETREPGGIIVEYYSYTCNSVTIPLYREETNFGSYRCVDFMMRLERPKWKFLPKSSPLGDVTDWSSVLSGRTFSNETGIYWLLAL